MVIAARVLNAQDRPVEVIFQVCIPYCHPLPLRLIIMFPYLDLSFSGTKGKLVLADGDEVEVLPNTSSFFLP